MKTHSGKQKGRRLQQFVRDCILNAFPSLTENDVRSTSMGASGEDVQLSEAALKLFPYKIECKNTERLNVWKAWEQANSFKSTNEQPVVIIKKNHHKPLAVIDAEHLVELRKMLGGNNE